MNLEGVRDEDERDKLIDDLGSLFDADENIQRLGEEPGQAEVDQALAEEDL